MDTHWQELKRKVQNTALFTPQEKIEILTAFDTFSDEDKTKLRGIIDEYDAKYKTITGRFKQHIKEELDSIEKDASAEEKAQVKTSVDKIRSGLDAVIPR